MAEGGGAVVWIGPAPTMACVGCEGPPVPAARTVVEWVVASVDDGVGVVTGLPMVVVTGQV